jgi:hypothetical protein
MRRRATMTDLENQDSSLFRHQMSVGTIYAISILLAGAVLRLPEAQKDLVALLSAGAIFATFGSAISTIVGVWERDLLERVRLNIDIFYKDILKQDNPWRRWPFLPRGGRRRLLDGSTHFGTLKNPEVPLNVGTHVIRVSLPTVLEDFFDLPLRRNVQELSRFRTAAATFFGSQEKGKVDDKTGMERGDAYMAFECLHDIWRSVLHFRLARYVTHLGVGLTLSGTALTVLLIAARDA